VGVCAVYNHFSGFGFILLSGSYPARPQTSNANRWAAVAQQRRIVKSSLSAWLEYYDETKDLHWLTAPTVMLVKLAFFAGHEAAQQSMHPTSETLRRFQASLTPEQLSDLKVLLAPLTCG